MFTPTIDLLRGRAHLEILELRLMFRAFPTTDLALIDVFGNSWLACPISLNCR